jgi:hypothetical protein
MAAARRLPVIVASLVTFAIWAAVIFVSEFRQTL